MLKKALLEYYLSVRMKSLLSRADGDCGVAQLVRIFESQQEQCAGCYRLFTALNFEVDHIIPIHLGGKTDRNNLQFLCVKCHSKKTVRQRVYSGGRATWRMVGRSGRLDHERKAPVSREEGRAIGKLLLR